MDGFTVAMFSVLGLIALSIPVLFIVSAFQLAKRANELRAFARHHGFTYTARAKLPADLRLLPYFKQGVAVFGRRMKNVLQREQHGEETLISDYAYLNPEGIAVPRNRTTRATVVCLRTKGSGEWAVFPAEGLRYLPVPEVHDFLQRAHAEWKREPRVRSKA